MFSYWIKMKIIFNKIFLCIFSSHNKWTFLWFQTILYLFWTSFKIEEYKNIAYFSPWCLNSNFLVRRYFSIEIHTKNFNIEGDFRPTTAKLLYRHNRLKTVQEISSHLKTPHFNQPLAFISPNSIWLSKFQSSL